MSWEVPTSLKMMVEGVASNPQSMSSETFMATQFMQFFVFFGMVESIKYYNIETFWQKNAAVPQEKQKTLRPLSNN